jgi:hypothetical protein
MIAKSIHGRSSEEVNAALYQAMADGYTPKLAIVFIYITQLLGGLKRKIEIIYESKVDKRCVN